MAAADLLFRITADTKGLKTGVQAAASELDRLQAAAAGAGNKLLSALPPSMANSVRGLSTSVSGLAGAFGGLGGIIAGMGVGKIVSDFLNTTGSLSDLSAQTDITVRDLQRFQYAGDLVGVSLDQITSAVGQLQNRLGSGDKSAFSALDQLGLSLKELQRLDPGQQFETIASAISRVTDPTKRAAISMDLFGRAGVTLLPLLRSDMKAVGDQAFILSDATVKAGDSFGDLYTRAKNLAGAAIGTVVLGPIVRGAEQIQLAMQDAGKWVDVLRQKLDNLPKQLPGTPAGFGAVRGAPSLTMTADEQKRLEDELNRGVKAQQDAAKAVADAWRREVKSISDAISGAAVVRDLKAWSEALLTTGASARVLADEGLRARLGTALDSTVLKFGSLKTAGVGSLTGIHTALIAMRQQAEMIPPAITPVLTSFADVATVSRDWGAANAATTETLLAMVDAGMHLPPLTKEQIAGFTKVSAETTTWRDGLASLAQSMTNLAQTTKSSFVGALASAANAMDVAFKSVTTLKGGFDTMTSGGGLKSILSGFTGMIGGIGGIVSAAQAAIQIGKALFNVFDRDKGRDLVEDFAKSFGGFDALHKRLNQLGEEGERLWIALTQGVGRNNPDQARSAIEEIQKALAGLATKVEDGVGKVIESMEGRGITLPVHFDVDELDVPGLAAGGVVRKPTLALVGESGPEAVVPLGQLGRVGGGSDASMLAALDSIDSKLARQGDVIFRAIRDGLALRTA